MALIYDKLKSCGVKISTTVSGVPNFGSGIIYATPNFCDYNYILTAKHIFQEDSHTPFDRNKLFNIEILYSEAGEFRKLASIKKTELFERLIIFEEDFAIIIINKKEDLNFRQILVSDEVNNEDEDFFSWATFSANPNELHHFILKRNDISMKRFQIPGNLNHSHMHGISGAGVFHSNKSVLFGIIYQYPNDDFQNETIDCVPISFSDINSKLRSLNKIQLDTHSSNYKKEINQEVVYIHEALINDVSLDLELARKRLKTDIEDDWFHDPLKYIDLLNKEYLFKQFEIYFGNKNYKALEAEKFYVPKKQFTLRQALISPFRDRIVYMAAVGVIAEKLDNALISNVYSARYNYFSKNQLIINGVEQWKKMKYKLSECANAKDIQGNHLYGCVIEIDLLNFYDNINKNLLHEKIKRVCETPNEMEAAKLLHSVIQNFSKKELGLPQNSDASSLLASFYLNQVDRFMQHNAFAYFRFMDDIRIFCEDKYEARKILQMFEFELRRCHLSVNSQKTKICSFVDEIKSQGDDLILRNHYNNSFDLELNKISRLRKSENYIYLNDAFHLSINLLKENLTEEDTNSSEDSARRLNYALNTISLLARKNINLYTEDSKFERLIEIAIKNLKDKPWITPQVCKVLNLIPTEIIKKDFLDLIKTIVLDERYNTYSFQTYQLWLLLSKHKCDLIDLKKFAVKQIEKNDQTNQAVIAAMIIYMCSVDSGYRRVILRKFEEGFTHGYFQKRLTLISLRSFPIDIIDKKHMSETLENAHEFTNKHKDKDLVFVQGFDENEEDFEHSFEQLYSI